MRNSPAWPSHSRNGWLDGQRPRQGRRPALGGSLLLYHMVGVSVGPVYAVRHFPLTTYKGMWLRLTTSGCSKHSLGHRCRSLILARLGQCTRIPLDGHACGEFVACLPCTGCLQPKAETSGMPSVLGWLIRSMDLKS